MTDREEAEREIARLRAAVNGLTEELVETKERLRLLEAQVDDEIARQAAEVAGSGKTDAVEGRDRLEDDREGSGDETVFAPDSGGDGPTVEKWIQKSDDHVEVVKNTRKPATDEDGTEVPSVDPAASGESEDDDQGEASPHAEIVTETRGRSAADVEAGDDDTGSAELLGDDTPSSEPIDEEGSKSTGRTNASPGATDGGSDGADGDTDGDVDVDSGDRSSGSGGVSSDPDEADADAEDRSGEDESDIIVA